MPWSTSGREAIWRTSSSWPGPPELEPCRCSPLINAFLAMRACSFSVLTSRQQSRPQSTDHPIALHDQQESEAPGEPRRLEAGPSIGHQRLKPWINRHPRQDALVLNEHLSRQLRQARITLSAERQIMQHLPGTLLQN